jgi:hypothetical protein
MKSRWIVNLLLLLGIVALGLIARFEPGIEPPAEIAAITSLRVEDVHRIHINRPIRDDLVLLRQSPDHWVIDRAAPLPAEDFKVRALARLAEQKPVRSYPVEEMDLAALQLAPPYATAILNDTPVEFGNLEPIDGLRYVHVGAQVYLIPDNYLPLLEAGFTQFVRQRLFAEGARIQAIRVPHLSVTHSDAGWLVEPEEQVSADVLQQFVEIWQEASALSIQPASPELAGEPVQIQLQGDQVPITLQIISREPELILARPDYGIQYRMGNRSEAMLTLDAAKADVKD